MRSLLRSALARSCTAAVSLGLLLTGVTVGTAPATGAAPATGTAPVTGTTRAVGEEPPVPTIEPPASVVALLSPEHPRLLATAEQFATARARIGHDDRFDAWFAKVRHDAEAMLGTTPVTDSGASNVLTTIREAKRRIWTLGAMYRLTDDVRYADRGIAELLAVSGFADWNAASHFLDVGEASAAVAVGYDWLYDRLTPAQRATVRGALVTKAMEPALPYYDTTGQSFFVGQSHNWNLVSNAVALGALAVGDEPETAELADGILRRSVTSIQWGIAEYFPDGAYAESPSYWQYGTDYLVTYLAALTSAVGTDFGLADLPGVAGTGDFGIHVTSAIDQTFNYGDGGSDLFGATTSGWHSPFMQWLAHRFDAPHLAAWQAARADRTAGPLDLLWYDPEATAGPDHPDATDAVFGGSQIATARSAWDDPHALYVATKGLRAGYDQVVGHENLDAGDLVLDANGVRWLDELGADTYGDAYFDWRKDVGGRWDYYVTRPEGQNTFLLDDGPVPSQALTAGAPVEAASGPTGWHAITDLTALYGDRVDSARRGVRLVDDRRQVIVQDEVRSTDPVDYRQFLLTRADVVVAPDGRSAVLYRGGQRLYLELLTETGTILVGDAAPLPGVPDPGGQRVSTGVRRLMIHVPDVTDTTVALRLVPLDTGQPVPSTGTAPAVEPLDTWQEAPAPTTALSGLRVGGHAVPGFDGERYRYDVLVPANRSTAPRVRATAGHGVVVHVEQAATLPGVARVSTALHDGGTTVPGPTYEVHLRQAGTTGLALPVADATASADDGNGARNAVDGSLGSRWSAEGDGQTLTLDLGRVRTVSAAALAFYNGHTRTATFDVLTSTNGRSWQQATTATTSGTTDDLEPYDLPTRHARYVRIVGHGASNSTFTSILEVRLYGSDQDAAADRPPVQQGLAAVTLAPDPLPELAVGESVPLTLTGTLSDGSPADLTGAEVTWASADPAVATATGGVLTATGGGTTTVGATVVLDHAWRTVRATVDVLDLGHLEAVADAHVQNGDLADTAYPRGNLEVRNNPGIGSGFERVSYLTFPLDAAAGHEISAARVHLYGRLSSEDVTTSVGVDAVADTSWTEEALTWNTAPPRGDRLGTLTLQGTAPAWYTLDVTDAVQALPPGADLGIALVGDVAQYGPHVVFTPRESATDRPYLELEVTP